MSHQVQVKSNELQPGYQGQEEGQVVMATDQGIPVGHETGSFMVALGLVSSIALPPQQASCVEV